MGHYQTILIDGIDELRSRSLDWNDLWQRSEATAPTARAELIAHWCEHFAKQSRFQAILVMQDGQPVLGLPLIQRQIGKVVSVGGLPGNEWSPAGDLLVDACENLDGPFEALVEAVSDLPWNLLWLEGVRLECRSWSRLIEAINRSSLSVEFHEQYRVGCIEMEGDWQQYRAQLSKSHRRSISKATKRLQARGILDSRLDQAIQVGDVQALMSEAFRIEDDSWKGEAGTSILRSDGMPEFFVRQAELLAQGGYLNLAWLTVEQQPIAFEYAMRAKGMYHSFKVGYDAEYACGSPGQLLIHHLLESFSQRIDFQGFDCMGPIGDSIKRWKPRTYPVGRLVIASQRPLAKALFFAYDSILPQVRGFGPTSPSPETVSAPV